MQPKANFAISTADPALYLEPTSFLESDAPEIRRFAKENVGDAATDKEKAVRLYYAVRDSIRYDPYHIPFVPEGYRATTVLREGNAFCIPKANLLAASARALGIPAGLGFADVKNHLCTQKLRDRMGTDLFVYHGYTLLWLEGKWVKATPAFNLTLCERFGVKPLEFDGETDALFHPFDNQSRRHMEYVRERGVFNDFPFQEITSAMREHYPDFESGGKADRGVFEEDAPLTT